MTDLATFRRALHRVPEVSGEEVETAARMAEMLRRAGADDILEGLGGHGVAAVFRGAAPGPRVLFRAELDALPITETGQADWRSTAPGKGHLCGHDGHMTFLAGLAKRLRDWPQRGEVVLMFQPAEETGQGAAAVTADPRYNAIRPTHAFAIHNMPGVPLGALAVQVGPMSCASRGMAITMLGRTAHASEPEKGLSPDLALTELIPALKALSQGVVTDPDFRLATVTHARLGEPAFGIAPGDAALFVTLRCARDAAMDDLVSRAVAIVEACAQRHGLAVSVEWKDVFVACENTAAAVEHVLVAADAIGLSRAEMALPMRASEDFGGFGGPGIEHAMIFVGSGEDCPPLHAPDYDFPDALIPVGVDLFDAIRRGLTG